MKFLSLIVVLLALMTVQAQVQAQAESQDPARHGRQLVGKFCSSCHAVGRFGRSPNRSAPPFRTFGSKFDLDGFPAMLERGISSTHPDMPVFKFSQDDARDVVIYLRSIQR